MVFGQRAISGIELTPMKQVTTDYHVVTFAEFPPFPQPIKYYYHAWEKDTNFPRCPLLLKVTNTFTFGENRQDRYTLHSRL